VCDVPAFTCDLFPTALATAGVDLPKDRPLDGVNLLPLFDGTTNARPPIVFHFDDHGKPGAKKSEVGHVGFAVVDGRWKLLTDRANREARLYDVVADVGETKDVAATNPQELTRLQGIREAWWKAVQAKPGFTATRSPKKKWSMN
jgi:arylsulfatase A-like enzyme